MVLVGLMASGKTTIGRELAARLGRRFVDSDEQVEERTGRTVREIFEADGEPEFRRLEAAAFCHAVDADEPAVIAAAGGVVLDPRNREALKRAGTVVWLRGEPEMLAARATTSDHRPLLAEDPAGVLSRMAREREPLYREVADAVVDVGDRSPEDIVAEVEEILR